MLHRFVTLCSLLLLTACALTPPPVPTDAAAARCLSLYETVDAAVTASGVTPSYPIPITGFPYLRVDRFLASYRDRALAGAELSAWLARLAERDRDARRVELASLSESARAGLATGYGPDLATALADCAQTLLAYDSTSPERLKLLRERAVVPSEYRTLNQVLGLYPLTSIPVTYGIYNLHQKTRQIYALPLAELPVRGELRRFHPPEPTSTAWPDVPRDALGIPKPTPEQLEVVFAIHAPIWEIDVAGDFDLPGTPLWRADGLPAVNPAHPVSYRYLSYTRWRGEPLLQLNYVVWFSERPLTGAFDLLGGALSGIIWRVTLNRNGEPLLYDVIHSCGCYHFFFPTPALRLRPEMLKLAEPPFVPQAAPPLARGQRTVIRIASGSHYIRRVYADAAAGARYQWRDFSDLYAVPVAQGGRRSLFGPDGLVAGSERRERWLLWPMGVPSAGAMREPGRHATAFVGRRHFDDAALQ